MLKKFVAIFCAVILSCGTIPSVCATEQNIDSELSLVYFTDFSALSTNASNNVIVISEEQMLQLGASVADLFEYTSTLYVLSAKSVDEIQRICGISASLHSEDESADKFATIIELTETGDYVFNNIFAIYDQDDSVECISSEEIRARNASPNPDMVADGLDAFLSTKSNQANTNARTQASGFSSYATDSAVLYDGQGGRIGTMGYTTYWYKIIKSGQIRIFDVICVATFAPDSKYRCVEMSVYMGTPFDNHEILEATNITSTGQTWTHSLSLSSGKDGVGGGYGASWAYTVEAQDVIKSFDMTSNDRTWTFKPIDAAAGDAWIEEPGIRMCSTQENCHTTISISCPKKGLLGIVTKNNTISTNWFFKW